jgi:hypothetical protein
VCASAHDLHGIQDMYIKCLGVGLFVQRKDRPKLRIEVGWFKMDRNGSCAMRTGGKEDGPM